MSFGNLGSQVEGHLLFSQGQKVVFSFSIENFNQNNQTHISNTDQSADCFYNYVYIYFKMTDVGTSCKR